jgi:hypothetical protein
VVLNRCGCVVFKIDFFLFFSDLWRYWDGAGVKFYIFSDDLLKFLSSPRAGRGGVYLFRYYLLFCLIKAYSISCPRGEKR